MELVLQRNSSLEHATLGRLDIDGDFECHTLEDVVREMPGLSVAQWKIAGESAIPAGRYQVLITRSARFGRDLPLLVGVEGFAGVRIHSGNTAADTEGCILVGRKAAGDTVIESRIAFLDLFEQIEGAIAAHEEVWIKIRNAEAAA